LNALESRKNKCYPEAGVNMRSFINNGIRFFNDQRKVGYIFVLPSIIIFSVFVFIPLIATVLLSFFNFDLMGSNVKFIGLENYSTLLKDERFWNSLGNTAYYTFISVPLQIVIALLTAAAISKASALNTMLRAAYFMPAICSMTIAAIIWSFLIDNDIGIFTYYLRCLGIKTIAWLKNPVWAMPAVIVVSIWKTFGFNMVILLAGLQGIPDTYYEVSEIDGAGKVKQFLHITLPMLIPTIGFVTITSVINSFQVFDQVYVMTHGGPLFKTETVVQYIYDRGFQL